MKSQHILSIQQALAEFDLQSQVKRITLQTMDAYMLGNKQAFQYIKQWESKFIEFEARLVKAQTYYHNIQININSKVQVTNSLSNRLEKFAEEFWANIKESAESLQQIRKNYMNLVKESGMQAASLRGFERDQKDLGNKINKLQQRMLDQDTKLMQKILQTEQSIISKNNERRSEAEDILRKVTIAKAEMDSKASTITALTKDLRLYQDEKISIISQIATLREELSTRVQISQFNKIRVYIDNSTNVNTLRIQEVYQQLTHRVDEEIDIRQSQIKVGHEMREILKQNVEKQMELIRNQMTTKDIQLEKAILKKDNQAKEKYRQNVLKITQNKERIQKIENNAQQLNLKLQQLASDLTEKNGRMHENEANIQSINYLLKSMEIQNSKRGEELAKLRVDADDKSDIGDQVQKLAEKILGHDENIRKLEQKIDNNAIKSQKMAEQVQKQISTLSDNTNKSLTNLQKTTTQNLNKTKQTFTDRCQKLDIIIQQKNQKVINQIKTRIQSIRDKFEFLQTLNKDMQQFKKTFQQQLEMNDQLNKQVKQKMDRMFGMFTKLKSDAFIKIQTLGQDIAKNVVKIKENTKLLSDISVLLSQYNQTLTILLSVDMWNQYLEDRQAPEEYKVASMIEGWILEATKDKTRFRGQYTTKRALIQLCLEQHVKTGDKIKGGFIQNGKEVFSRMAGGSEDYQQSRRRSMSRKKQRQSELPKVYR